MVSKPTSRVQDSCLVPLCLVRLFFLSFLLELSRLGVGESPLGAAPKELFLGTQKKSPVKEIKSILFVTLVA